MSIDNLPICFAIVAGAFVLIMVVNILFDKRFNRDFDIVTSMKQNARLSIGVMLLVFLVVILSAFAFMIVYSFVEYLIK